MKIWLLYLHKFEEIFFTKAVIRKIETLFVVNKNIKKEKHELFFISYFTKIHNLYHNVHIFQIIDFGLTLGLLL